MMKNIAYLVVLLFLLVSCANKKAGPDVSGVEVTLQVQRFDKDFFSIDTLHAEQSLNNLEQKYGTFLSDFLYNILGLHPDKDTVLFTIKKFIQDYQPVYTEAQKQFGSMDEVTAAVKSGLQHVKYYFPGYPLPVNLITFIGPIEGYANVLTQSGLAVGLQLYLGKDFSVYNSNYINEVYPAYQQRRFEKQYIPVNCMKNIIDDIYPENNSMNSLPLIYQMVEAGKRLYLLDAFLPGAADTVKTGYTSEQLKGSYENEAMIWNYFVQNNLLFINDPMMIRDYMNDAPRTDVLGPASPGFIGQFVGWQIIKKWLEGKENISPQMVINTPAKTIYEEAKYKPR